MANMISEREKQHQKVIGVYSNGKLAEVECLTCGTLHTAEREEDGASIDQHPCQSDDCTLMLCSECLQFACDGCGLSHCVSHRVKYNELELCPVCIADFARCDDQEVA